MTFSRASNASSSRRILVPLGLLVLATAVFLVYWPATRGPFIFDDSATIVDNPSIRRLWPLWGGEPGGGPLNPNNTTPTYGRPLVNLSFAMNHHFGGLDPFGYRVAHIVIHILSATLLWAILWFTLRLDFFRGRFDRAAGGLSFAAALIWAVHPVATESVVYVTQRTELLMGMFYLMTIYGSLRYWTATRTAARVCWLTLTVIACLSGMLSKEMMASAPGMVLLYERTFIAGSFRQAWRQSWPLYVGLAITWLPLLALNYHGPRTPGAGFGQGVAAHVWWFTQAKVVFLYLKLAIWPWPLVIHYEIPYLNSLAAAWPWLLATGLLATVAAVLVWRRRAVGFVIVWFFAVLSPTLLVPLHGETAAERRMYVPLAALVPLLVVGGYALVQRSRQYGDRNSKERSSGVGVAAAFSVTMVAVAVGFAYLGACRLEAYKDRLSLWQDAALHQPHNPVVQFNLGTVFAESGQLPQAIVYFEEAVRYAPDSYRGHYNLARALEASGRTPEAIESYRMTLQLRSDDAASHYNLARLLEDTGQTTEAIEHYRQAIAAQPDFSAAHTNLGLLRLDGGQLPAAIEHFQTALRLQKDSVNYVNLMVAYSHANRHADAIAMANKALELARSDGDEFLIQQLTAALADLRRSSR